MPLRRPRFTFPSKPFTSCLNTGDQLAKDLRLFASISEGGGRGVVNQVDGSIGSEGGSSFIDITWGNFGDAGLGILPTDNGLSQFYTFPGSKMDTPNTITVGVYTTAMGDAFTTYRCLGKYNVGSLEDWSVKSINDMTFSVTGSGGTNSISLSRFTYGDRAHLFIWTYDGSQIVAYVDGVQVATSSGTVGTLNNTASRDVYLGGFAAGGNTNWKKPIHAAYMWARVLNPGEVSEIWRRGYGAMLAGARLPLASSAAAQAAAFLRAHPVINQASFEPITTAYATLTAHPVMAAATGPIAVLTAAPSMVAIAEIPPTAFLQACPTMAPATIAGQVSTCVVDPQPTGIGTGGTVDGLIF